MTSTGAGAKSCMRHIHSVLTLGAILLVASVSAVAVPVISGNSVQTARLTGGATNSATMAPFNYTTPTGALRFLLIGISMNVSNDTGSTVASVTYNGTALTLVAARTNANNSRRVEFWRMVNPPTGSNAVNIVANVTNTRSVGFVVSLTSFNGVDQTTPLG